MVGSREFFSPTVALASREQVLAQLARLDVDPLILPVDATANGAVQSREDAKLYARFFREHREEIDGLVVLLPNFGDEIAILETLRLADLEVPLLLQASNDEIDKVDVKRRRDAFCGKISVTNNLYQYGIPFTDTATHTCDVDGDAFRADLDQFARVCRVVRGLGKARIGAIGARTGAFQTMRYSEKLLQAAGITRRHRRPLGDHRRRHRDRRRRCDREGQARRDLRLRPDPRPHRPRQHRQAGEMEPRRRPLDRRERMRCELDPVLELAAEQFRLRHLPHHVDHGREADALAPARST